MGQSTCKESIFEAWLIYSISQEQKSVMNSFSNEFLTFASFTPDRHAKNWGNVIIVSLAWLDACRSEGLRQDESKYPPPPPASHGKGVPVGGGNRATAAEASVEARGEVAAGGRHRHPGAGGGQQGATAGPAADSRSRGDSAAPTGGAGEVGMEDQNGIAPRGRRASLPPATTTRPPKGASSTERGRGEGDGMDAVAGGQASTKGKLREGIRHRTIFAL